MERVRLLKIPEKIQRRFCIGEEVDAASMSDVMGGRFVFKNLRGIEESIDAVELSNTGILVQVLS
jgi:hypothetical protein